MLSVSLFGDFCIRHNEALITDVDTPRLQSLLAFLLLHRDAPQSRAHIAFLFWPDTTEAQARTNLRNLLHHLRRALPEADTYLDIGTQTLQWWADASFTLDVADFNAALARAAQVSLKKDTASAREALERAVSIYKGDLLSCCYDDWIIQPREELRQVYLGALERLVSLLEDQRDYQAAIRYARRILACDPLDEATYRHLIRLYALDGDRAGALRAYHTCTTVLRRELEVEPGAATREAYKQLLGVDAQPSLTLTPTTAFSPLVGREVEWTQMLQAWRAVIAGRKAHVVMLRGEAGIGKSRLAEEMLQWAARQGISNASARCYAAEGELAYAPVTAWLRAHPLAPLEDVWLAEVARLLPEILNRRPDLPRPGMLTEAWQRQHLFEALSRAILGVIQPLLLVLDDLQWCDRDTLEWLHYLLRFDQEARLLVVGAYRPEEVLDGHPLVSWLQALRLEEQVTELDLGPLNETDTQILAAGIAGMDISRTTAQFLYRETEGNPLFVVETVRAGLPAHERDSAVGAVQKQSHDAFPGNADLPPKVRSVLETRLAQVSPPSRDLAGLAATIGREFRLELLARASGCDEETLVRQLDELWQRRIVREHGVDAYDFSHDKLREVAYHGLSAARRRLLHHHVAQALEVLHGADLDPVSRQLAAHYDWAGLALQSARYYLRASGVARRVYANDEAIALLQRGLALVGDDQLSVSRDERGYELAAQLWEALGDILEQRAQHEAALQAYSNAKSHAPNRDRVWQARLLRKEGGALREQRLYANALAACHRAEVVLGEQPGEDTNPWWDEWLEVQVGLVWAHYWLAQWPEMEAVVHKIKPVVQERGKPASRAIFLWASCMMQLRRDHYVVSEGMLAEAREGLAASQELGNLKTIVEWNFELGFLHLWRREFDEAYKYLHIALELVETAGFIMMRVLTLTYLTVLHRFQGQEEAVLSYAQQAYEAAEAAHMPDYIAAARGNQAWLAWRGQDLQAVERLSKEALVIWQQSPLLYPFQWQALWPLIAVSLARDREDDAWNFVKALLEPKQQHLPDPLYRILASAVQARAQEQVGTACSRLDQATGFARDMGYL